MKLRVSHLHRNFSLKCFVFYVLAAPEAHFICSAPEFADGSCMLLSFSKDGIASSELVNMYLFVFGTLQVFCWAFLAGAIAFSEALIPNVALVSLDVHTNSIHSEGMHRCTLSHVAVTVYVRQRTRS